MTIRTLETAQDAISSIEYSSKGQLLAASWDEHVYLYDLDETIRARIRLNAPVLDICWEDAQIAWAGGLDGRVRRIDIERDASSVTKEHRDAVSAIVYNPSRNAVITGSWDKTIQVLDNRSNESATAATPHKVFSLDTVEDKIVVAGSERAIWIYDIRNLDEPIQRRESSLKYMTRRVKCMPNGKGYASSSIEGRVAVEFFDPSPEAQAKKYAFKCHRQSGEEADTVYPVNDIAFHPHYGTFATAGGDGVVALWDGVARKRLRQYPHLPCSIASIAFAPDGQRLAIACSSGHEDGKEEAPQQVSLHVRELAPGEGRGK